MGRLGKLDGRKIAEAFRAKNQSRRREEALQNQAGPVDILPRESRGKEYVPATCMVRRAGAVSTLTSIARAGGCMAKCGVPSCGLVPGLALAQHIYYFAAVREGNVLICY